MARTVTDDAGNVYNITGATPYKAMGEAGQVCFVCDGLLHVGAPYGIVEGKREGGWFVDQAHLACIDRLLMPS